MKRFGEDRAGQLAALVAYYGFFSLFPLMLFMVTVLGIVLRDYPALQESILHSALSQFPIIGTQLRENIHSLQGNALAVVLGLAGALWAGLGGLKAAQNAMDKVWNVPMKWQPTFVTAITRGSLMLAVLGGFTLVAAALSGFGAGGEAQPLGLRVLGIAASLLVNFAVFLLAYRILTVEGVSWRDVLPGAVFAAIAWTALQAVGGYFVARQLKDASEVYGFFAIVIGLLSWIYLGAQILMYGAEINVVVARRLWPRSLVKSDLTDADRRALRGHARVEERHEEEDVDVSFHDRRASGQ